MTTSCRLAFAAFLLAGVASAEGAGPEIGFDAKSGTYRVSDSTLGWRLSGRIDGAVRNVRDADGRDENGPFREISFEWNEGGPVRGAIRAYRERPVAQFRLTYLGRRDDHGVVFPNFTDFPADLTGFSYRDQRFAPAAYELAQTSTPWLFFDPRAHALILSPASSFMVAKMVGDGKTAVGEGLNDRLRGVPAGFEQDSLLAFGDGIGKTWDAWGAALRARYRRKLPANDADTLLRLFGYWTDNGADYYYAYEPNLGYAGTLLALRDRYRREGIPLGYLQLDSWWYDKTTDDPAGRPGGATKNSKLPAGLWNRYGGTWLYHADADLFPNGLDAFQRALGLPLAVHSRWIDPKSPYHAHYRISGVGAVDPAWWNDIEGYLAAAGVVCYEQDWLDNIYDHSPEMPSKAGVADAFTDGMANAARRRGIDLQYCMATPRFFLQGVKYPNLTTIRTSDDRFDRRKWADFLYASQLAQEAGIWPWCDVFMSHETGNLILSVLSAGPVGTGDAMGREDKANILRAVRPDGVIVKPDHSLVPCDQTYLDREAPFLAATDTEQSGARTVYVFAFPRSKESRTARFRPRDRGFNESAYLYDFQTGQGRLVAPDETIEIPIDETGYAYSMLAPVRHGIALLGDLDKIVPTGKQRLPAIDETAGGLTVRVAFARGESAATLTGVCAKPPRIRADHGTATLAGYDPATGRFTVSVAPDAGGSAELAIQAQP